jgi:predicted MFS family arabinose efflux permease
MYGVGFITFYYPILSMLSEYWIKRRGMMAGIMCSASGLSGTMFPFAIESALRKYGYPTTLRAIAIGLCVLTGPLIPFLNGRLPETDVRATAIAKTDWSFMRSSLFWVYSVSNLAMGFGYFFPSLYIPSYATANGMTAAQGALLLMLMSISQVLGQLIFGYLSDHRVSINILAGFSTLIAGIAVYTCWGLGHSFPVLSVFAIVYGFFGSGYTALYIGLRITP